ncbi:chloride channel protein [Rubrimonas cliftonensis]|uniref:Chloride channel protein, CIC family n=1 Tax=Rubrimonas cliftonensis TaxID=89524 RepID=A0A1H3YQF7_9RHOB|nr:chloride channel protein [Rubrimonas cliftonensis]SEA13252.1 chloride channel protein, CIC family [Rubrimonas cliftonensis]
MSDQPETSSAPASPPASRHASPRAAVRAAERAPKGDARAALVLWLVALLVGVLAGYAAIGFRLAIALIQTQLYGADDETIHSAAAELNPLLVIAIPVAGGVAVGWILSRFTANGKALGVSDVIEAAALRDGRVNRREGCASAAAALVTLSTGGSTGREGPAVHLAAVIAGWIEDRFDFHGLHARDILGCAVAAAVSASFNAPLAGTLFALEVVLRHYAVHAFGPIVLASVAGAVISRIHMGDVTEFVLPPPTPAFYAEIPAFALLGVTCGAVAVLMINAIFIAEGVGDRVTRRFGLGPLQRPALAGALLGVMAVGFPHIIGVGYETTSRALTMGLDFWTCVVFAAAKTVAVGLTFAGRMGGGVFSPSLMMGALVGAAFGIVATEIAPVPSGSQGLYAVAGMGAVASAVLGAPISTTLIVFELTGDYQAAIAVMVSVSLATVVAHAFVRKSFFLTQLARAGVALASGPQSWLPKTIPVRRLMRLRGAEDCASDTAAQALIDQGAWLTRDDTLALALPMFDRLKGPFIPVVDAPPEGEPELIGALYHVDALKAVNRILEETHREEHS